MLQPWDDLWQKKWPFFPCNLLAIMLLQAHIGLLWVKHVMMTILLIFILILMFSISFSCCLYLQCHNKGIFDILYYPNLQEGCSKQTNYRMIKRSYAIHLLWLCFCSRTRSRNWNLKRYCSCDWLTWDLWTIWILTSGFRKRRRWLRN